MTSGAKDLASVASARRTSIDTLVCACSRALPLLVILLTIASASLAVGIALQFGPWTEEEAIHGPFPTESGTRTALVPLAGMYRSIPCCIGSRSDTNDRPFASSLRAWLNGSELDPPHTSHDVIRS